MSGSVTVAHVVLGLPIPRVWSYAVPPDLTGRLEPGQRVRVPFRGKPRIGVVVSLDGGGEDRPANTAPPAGLDTVLDGQARSGLEPLDAAVDPVPALTPALLDLARWAAEETSSAWGEAVARALPPGLRSGAPPDLVPARAPRESGRLVVMSGTRRGPAIEAAVAAAVDRDEGVLCLAPEIDQARAWAERLGRRVGTPLHLATSAEPASRRWRAWWAARQGTARIVVGTRTAAFVPLNPLELMVVLDEEDPAHKAPESPRWHARSLALGRQAREGGTCVLAAAAPSLEAWVWAETGRAERRDPGGPWPAVHRVDLRGADPNRVLSPGLRDATRAALDAGHSVLLLLNRLGYGRILACTECGVAPRCPRCRLSLTFHQAARTLACRLCGTRLPARSLCPRCRGRRLAPVGWGTERVEAEARRAFPDVGLARYDGTLSPKTAAAVREGFARREVRVLVGTQMALRVAAVTPVGLAALVHVDTTLSLPDFRAGERTLQTAWRLAEAVIPGGSLWLQSAHPDHPALEAIAAGDLDGFYRREWAERRELGYPPARRMARLVLEGQDAGRRAEDLVPAAQTLGLTVLGPATLPGHRAQVVLLGDDALPRGVSELLTPFRGHRRLGAIQLAVDIDPVEQA